MSFDPFESPVPLGGYVWFALLPSASRAQRRPRTRPPTPGEKRGTERRDQDRAPLERAEPPTLRRAFGTALARPVQVAASTIERLLPI